MSAEALPWLILGLSGIAGYLLGSIPFGMLLTRWAGLGDIRKIGSGNIGATNVLRTGRPALGALTLVLDVGKGVLAAGLGYQLGLALGLTPGLAPGLEPQLNLAWAAALGVIAGHNFPIYLNFRGGKGVATSFGVLFVLLWPVGTIAAITWLAVALLSRYASLASLLAIGTAPLWTWLLFGSPQVNPHTIGALIMALLVCLSHRSNIRRLWYGREFPIGSTARGPAGGVSANNSPDDNGPSHQLDSTLQYPHPRPASRRVLPDL